MLPNPGEIRQTLEAFVNINGFSWSESLGERRSVGAACKSRESATVQRADKHASTGIFP